MKAETRKRRRETATVILIDALMRGPLTNTEAIKLLEAAHIFNNRQYAAHILKPFVKTGEVLAKLDRDQRRYWVFAHHEE